MILRKLLTMTVWLLMTISLPAKTVSPLMSKIFGHVTDNQGRSIAGVVVSDGYRCVTTNRNGIYRLNRHTGAKFVFYTNPKGYEPDSKGFFQPLSKDKQEYNFVLGQHTGNDTHFRLLLITDPQVRSEKSYNRFTAETVPAMKQTIAGSTLPVVGWCLGDEVHEQCAWLENGMHSEITNLGIPFFSVIGNHDYFKVEGSDKDTAPRTADEYEKYWGPTWYSFNKGDVHFIALNNVKYTSGISYDHLGNIDAEQLAWMKEDLRHVDKSKLIIVGYHIPMSHTTGANSDDETPVVPTGRDEMLKLLAAYPNRLLMAGHTHYMRHSTIAQPIKSEERIHAAACGAFWWTTANSDGTPNGYSVYEIDGNKIVNNWYRTVNVPDAYKDHPRDFQIRLHHGDATFGGQYGTCHFGNKTPLPSGYVVANIWNWDPQWKVTVTEDNGAPVTMTQGTKSKPKVCHDAWAPGYLIGVRHRAPAHFRAYCQHLFVYKLKNPNARVTVTATDRYGNSYTQSAFTTDFTDLKVDGADFKP